MVNWDDSLDKRLLLTIIAVAAPSAIDYKKVAALMGDGYTSGSVQQRYTKKLKKEVEEKFGALGAAGEGKAAAKSPPKKKTTSAKEAAGEKSSTSKRKAKKNASEDEEEEKDDEESPSKKVKMEQTEESEGEDEL